MCNVFIRLEVGLHLFSISMCDVIMCLEVLFVFG
jgi:hypothetical protein